MSFLTRTVALHRLKYIHRSISSTAIKGAVCKYNIDFLLLIILICLPTFNKTFLVLKRINLIIDNLDDYKPGPYPKTKEEREAAAKKYGLHPSEYEPYPDDGLGHGDYPKLPDIAVEERDPFYPWDYPDAKRNFGEPVNSTL